MTLPTNDEAERILKTAKNTPDSNAALVGWLSQVQADVRATRSELLAEIRGTRRRDIPERRAGRADRKNGDRLLWVGIGATLLLSACSLILGIINLLN